MKIFDYVRASKTKKSIGEDFAVDIQKWKKHHKEMVEAMQTGEYEPIHLKTDEMRPENLIFYYISGSKIIDRSTMFSIDTTTIDNGYEYTQHIFPTYILVKSPNSTHEPASLDNTTMYRVTYHKQQEDTTTYKYTIDTLIENEDPTTAKFFPEIFCSLDVVTSSYLTQPKSVLSYKPLRTYNSGNRFEHKENLRKISELYENRIIKKIKKFGNHPTRTFDAESEM